MSVLITKADGNQEPFKEEKLKHSLRRAGAHKDEIDSILAQVTSELHNGITTQEIYRRAFALLRESSAPVRARYSLRRALFGLGPTGFPFETFLARLFEAEGYTTSNSNILQGKCAEHEIDLAAYQPEHSFVAEAKFHARPGIKSDLQVAMYSYARLLDLQEQKICNEDICGIQEFWIITNTKFTSAARKYGECVGLNMLSWDYPKTGNLHDLIQKHGVYPITVLQSLSSAQAATLIARDIILCSELIQNHKILRHLHISKRKTESILNEATALCRKTEQ
ncbi:MAG: ATP cone domain-containing protein [Patescibacteria group bacterium]